MFETIYTVSLILWVLVVLAPIPQYFLALRHHGSNLDRKVLISGVDVRQSSVGKGHIQDISRHLAIPLKQSSAVFYCGLIHGFMMLVIFSVEWLDGEMNPGFIAGVITFSANLFYLRFYLRALHAGKSNEQGLTDRVTEVIKTGMGAAADFNGEHGNPIAVARSAKGFLVAGKGVDLPAETTRIPSVSGGTLIPSARGGDKRGGTRENRSGKDSMKGNGNRSGKQSSTKGNRGNRSAVGTVIPIGPSGSNWDCYTGCIAACYGATGFAGECDFKSNSGKPRNTNSGKPWNGEGHPLRVGFAVGGNDYYEPPVSGGNAAIPGECAPNSQGILGPSTQDETICQGAVSAGFAAIPAPDSDEEAYGNILVDDELMNRLAAAYVPESSPQLMKPARDRLNLRFSSPNIEDCSATRKKDCSATADKKSLRDCIVSRNINCADTTSNNDCSNATTMECGRAANKCTNKDSSLGEDDEGGVTSMHTNGSVSGDSVSNTKSILTGNSNPKIEMASNPKTGIGNTSGCADVNGKDSNVDAALMNSQTEKRTISNNTGYGSCDNNIVTGYKTDGTDDYTGKQKKERQYRLTDALAEDHYSNIATDYEDSDSTRSDSKKSSQHQISSEAVNPTESNRSEARYTISKGEGYTVEINVNDFDYTTRSDSKDSDAASEITYFVQQTVAAVTDTVKDFTGVTTKPTFKCNSIPPCAPGALECIKCLNRHWKLAKEKRLKSIKILGDYHFLKSALVTGETPEQFLERERSLAIFTESVGCRKKNQANGSYRNGSYRYSKMKNQPNSSTKILPPSPYTPTELNERRMEYYRFGGFTVGLLCTQVFLYTALLLSRVVWVQVHTLMGITHTMVVTDAQLVDMKVIWSVALYTSLVVFKVVNCITFLLSMVVPYLHRPAHVANRNVSDDDIQTVGLGAGWEEMGSDHKDDQENQYISRFFRSETTDFMGVSFLYTCLSLLMTIMWSVVGIWYHLDWSLWIPAMIGFGLHVIAIAVSVLAYHRKILETYRRGRDYPVKNEGAVLWKSIDDLV